MYLFYDLINNKNINIIFMSRFTRIEKERKKFLKWKDNFSCNGNPKICDNI